MMIIAPDTQTAIVAAVAMVAAIAVTVWVSQRNKKSKPVLPQRPYAPYPYPVPKPKPGTDDPDTPATPEDK